MVTKTYLPSNLSDSSDSSDNSDSCDTSDSSDSSDRSDKAQELKLWQNSKTQVVKKHEIWLISIYEEKKR